MGIFLKGDSSNNKNVCLLFFILYNDLPERDINYICIRTILPHWF